MLRKTFVLVVAFGALQAARADRIIEQPETSFEVLLAYANVPAGGVGDVSFKTCANCTPQSRLLTASTRFYIGSRETRAADFVTAVNDIHKAEIRDPRALLMLYVDKATLHVNRAVVMQPTH